MKRGLSMAMLALMLLGSVSAGTGAWADKHDRDDGRHERAHRFYTHNHYQNRPYGYYRSNYVHNLPHGNKFGHFKQRDRWEANQRWDNNRRWDRRDRWENARWDNNRWNNRNDNFLSRWF